MRKKKCRQPLDISIFSFFPSIAKLMVLDLEPFTSEINAEITRSSCGGAKSYFLIFCPRHPMTIVFLQLKNEQTILTEIGDLSKGFSSSVIWVRSLSLGFFLD